MNISHVRNIETRIQSMLALSIDISVTVAFIHFMEDLTEDLMGV